MALVVFDRVQETTATTGTGTLTLGGAVAGFQTFAVVGNGNTTYYTIVNGSDWEVGIGTYSSTGPTLARTTVLSNSLGTTVPISLVGASNVFVTYPAEKSVNLDASGNVSPLGTIASGTWQGSTIGVAYGGTGVTSSSGANSVVLRDVNANVTFNNFTSGFAATTAAAGVTILTVASARTQVLVGSTTQTIQMPDATTLQIGQSFIFVNNSSGVLTITNNASATIDTIPSGGAAQIGVTSIATSAGSWGIYSFLPGTYNFSIPTADFGNATITNATYQGNTVASGYGGTGLTTFSAANNALFSTGASTLTAGTLPVAAGGTGVTSATANGIVYGSGTTPLGVTAAGTTGQVLIGNTGAAPSWGTVSSSLVSSFSAGTTGLTPSTATTGAVTLGGTLAVANGGTGATTATANTVFAGPTTGAAAAPAFRALVAADIPSTYSQFASGTVLLFYQAAAPTGWTQVTTQNNKALRVVSGTGGGTGGSVAFTTAFASQTPSGSVSTSITGINGSVSVSISNITGTVSVAGGSVGATTLTASQIPAHTHSFSGTTGQQSADHAHGFSGGTGGVNANHSHALSGNAVAANQAFLLGAGGQVTFGDATVVNTTNTQSNDHAHGFSGSTGGVNANHNHGFSGTTDNGTGGGQSHTHGFTNPTASFSYTGSSLSSGFTFNSGTASSAFTGSAINLAVQYIDIIICSKN
jgi:hypothetical protein